MKTIAAYHRPDSLDSVVSLLTRTDLTTTVLAGGTALTTVDLPPDTEIVDLQDAVPAGVYRSENRVIYGAMTRLTDLIDHDDTPPLLAELARREGPNTLRNASTIGGTVAGGDAESELIAGLLVHNSSVAITGIDGDVLLTDLLADTSVLDRAVITAVSVEIGGETTSERTGRTPADTSIVAAAGRVAAGRIQVALTGVASTPTLVDPGNVAALTPPADFRGSSEYRLALAEVLTARVVARLGGAS